MNNEQRKVENLSFHEYSMVVKSVSEAFLPNRSRQQVCHGMQANLKIINVVVERGTRHNRRSHGPPNPCSCDSNCDYWMIVMFGVVSGRSSVLDMLINISKQRDILVTWQGPQEPRSGCCPPATMFAVSH